MVTSERETSSSKSGEKEYRLNPPNWVERGLTRHDLDDSIFLENQLAGF